MRQEIKPKLHFEVGEKVVICACLTKFGGYGVYNNPNENNFTFTTVKEVKEDGSVIVEEGYAYAQAYETQYGDTKLLNWFKIKRTPKDGCKFNEKEYYRDGKFANVHEKASFSLPTILLKCNSAWEEARDRVQQDYEECLTKKAKEEKERAEKEAREKPYRDTYKDVVEPLEKALYEAKVKAWREHMCGHCKHNHDGHCWKWNQKVAESDTTHCTAFEV